MNKLVIGGDAYILRESRTITLFGDIEDNGSDSVNDFIRGIEILSLKKEPINIIIKSCGGDLDEALACISAIKKAKANGCKVIGTVYGHADSAAFLLLQICDERIIDSTSFLMAHGINIATSGDINSRQSEVKLISYLQTLFADMVASRCIDKKKYSVNYWKKVLADQTPIFYNCNEALAIGLVDKIVC
jgi:ATP-dependent protease ClpP protease subunit